MCGMGWSRCHPEAEEAELARCLSGVKQTFGRGLKEGLQSDVRTYHALSSLLFEFFISEMGVARNGWCLYCECL